MRDFDINLVYNIIGEIFLDYNSIYKSEDIKFFLYNNTNNNEFDIIIESGFYMYIFLATINEYQKSNSDFCILFKSYNSLFIKNNTQTGILYLIEKVFLNNCIENKQNTTNTINTIKNAMNFFHSNTLNIEVVKNNKLEIVFFPELNFLKKLTDDIIMSFRHSSNRTSIQTKIASIFNFKDSIFNDLKQAEKVSKFAKKFKFLSILFEYTNTFQFLALLFAVIMNILIFLGYIVESSSEEIILNTDLRLKEIKLFFTLDTYSSRIVVFIVGTFLTVCSFIVFLKFLTRKAPLIYKSKMNEYYEKTFNIKKNNLDELGINRVYYNFRLRFVSYLIQNLKAFKYLLFDFEVMYEIGYITFAILAFLVHYFFFVYHLIDFIRTQQVLINVLKSIYNSRVQLFFTLMFYLILIYFYALIFYYFFYDDMPPYTCDSIFLCIITIFTNTVSLNL